MRIVLDTNVLVSGLLKPYSAPSLILGLVISGLVKVAYDIRILTEYKEVLLRPKFEFLSEWIEFILIQIQEDGVSIIPLPLNIELADQSDMPFLEVATSGKVDALITGNKKHFPQRQCKGIRVFDPKEFLEFYKKTLEKNSD